jgi:hypothetical protein
MGELGMSETYANSNEQTVARTLYCVYKQRIRFISPAKCGPETSASVRTKPTENWELADVFPMDIRMILLVRRAFVPHGRVNFFTKTYRRPNFVSIHSKQNTFCDYGQLKYR